MRFAGERTAVWEQRMCEYAANHLVVIAWVENLATGQAYNNHIVLSQDGSKCFSQPIDTGIRGQAAGITALRGGLVLSLHAMRKGTDEPGILAVIADLNNGEWEEKARSMIWHAPAIKPNTALPGVFSAVRFGQPSAVSLGDGRLLVSYWREEEG